MHPIQQVLVAIFVTTFVNRKIHKSKISKMEDQHRLAVIKESMDGWTRGYEVGELDGRKNMWFLKQINPNASWYKSTS